VRDGLERDNAAFRTDQLRGKKRVVADVGAHVDERVALLEIRIYKQCRSELVYPIVE